MPANDDLQKAQRFREAALPHLDDVYTLARYLLRDPSDAEDAVQECYLRALKAFRQLSRAGDKALAIRDPA
ncbi:DNA-directed RNA polymerase specialized sigma24 family protein [Bradyrhizobium sp. GM0.4]